MTLARFPFPFTSDTYRYGTDIEPAGTHRPTETGGWGDTVIEVDAHYRDDLRERAAILARDPARRAVLPHMRPAAWDALDHVLTELAASRPGAVTLDRRGRHRRLRNRLTGTDRAWTHGDASTLPEDPLTFACSQVQDDVVLLDQREGALWADAGLVTFAADWSLDFVLGLPLREIHGPVPRVHADGVIGRAERFLLRLEPGATFRRTNWSLTCGRTLDTATESYPRWGRERLRAAREGTLPDLLHLRVEVQHVVRLAGSHAVLFLIRTHLAPLRDIAAVPAWRDRFRRVLAGLPDDVAAYKGLHHQRAAAAKVLAAA